MKIVRFFTRLAQSFRHATSRFPIPALLIAAIPIFILLNIFDTLPTTAWEWKIYYCFIISLPVSLSVALASEYRKVSPSVSIFASIAAVFLCATFCFFLPEDIEYHKSLFYFLLAFSACLLYLPFFCGFYPFTFRSGRHVPRFETSFWNFSGINYLTSVVGGLIGCIFSGGISFACLFISSLFDVHISEKIYFSISILCGFTLPLFYFIGNMLSYRRSFTVPTPTHRGLRTLGLFVLLPITALYFLILYVYAAKILFSSTLPKDPIVIFVTVSFCLFLLINFLIYPFHTVKPQPLPNFIARYGGYFPIPLLLLMSISILYRIDEYSWTIHRFYTLILNIWFYVVCTGLIITRSKRIRWIPLTFLLGFLFFSVGPWSASSVSRRAILSELSHYHISPQDLSSQPVDTLISRMDALPQDSTQRASSLGLYYVDNFSDTKPSSKITSALRYRSNPPSKSVCFSYDRSNDSDDVIFDLSPYLAVYQSEECRVAKPDSIIIPILSPKVSEPDSYPLSISLPISLIQEISDASDAALADSLADLSIKNLRIQILSFYHLETSDNCTMRYRVFYLR